MIIRRVCAIVVMLCISLTACSDSREIDDDIYPIIFGVDKGTTNKIRLTILYPTYKGGGGGGGTSGEKDKGDAGESNKMEGANIHTIEAASIIEALNLFNTTISRTVSLTHGKMLVISEEFAKGDIENYLLPMLRFREARRSLQVVVVSGRTEEFISDNKPNIGESVSKAVELMLNQSKVTGYFPYVNLNDFYEDILSPYSQAVAIYSGINNLKNINTEKEANISPIVAGKRYLPGELPRSGIAKREFVGTAVFSGARMVGTLDNMETRYMQMVKGEYEKGTFNCIDKRDPKRTITFIVNLGQKPKITSKLENGKPIIGVKLKIEADVGEIQSRIAYEDMKMINELNAILKEDIEEGIKGTIEKTQKYNSDIFGFGFSIAKHFKTIPEFIDYNWLAHYKEAKVNVYVDANIRRTGLMLKSGSIFSSESGKEGEK